MPSTRFLFWNINRKPLAGLVADLADEHRIDVVMLAECDVEPVEVVQTLNRHANEFHFPEGPGRAIRMFTRFAPEFVHPAFDAPRYTIRRLRLPARAELLLAVVHLPSKLHQADESQKFACIQLGREIAARERLAGHQRTLVVGDFNMNPFESGMVATEGLHSVMSRQISSRGSRIVQGTEYQFFYNPMWSHFGDARSHTAGSCFYESAEHVNYFWNIFDQVLIRPDLTELFDADKLKIVTSVGSRLLVRPDGRPDNRSCSDHLPIVFEIEF